MDGAGNVEEENGTREVIPYDAGLPVQDGLKSHMETVQYVMRLLDAGMGLVKGITLASVEEQSSNENRKSVAQRCIGCMRCGCVNSCRGQRADALEADAQLDGDEEFMRAEMGIVGEEFGKWKRIPGSKPPALYSASTVLSLADLAVMFRSKFGISYKVPADVLAKIVLAHEERFTVEANYAMSKYLSASRSPAEEADGGEDPAETDAGALNVMARVPISAVDVVGFLLVPELSCAPGQCESMDAALDALFRGIAGQGSDSFGLDDLEAYLRLLRDPELTKMSEKMMRSAVDKISDESSRAGFTARDSLKVHKSGFRKLFQPPNPHVYVTGKLEETQWVYMSTKWTGLSDSNSLKESSSSASKSGSDANLFSRARDGGAESVAKDTLERHDGTQNVREELTCKLQEQALDAKQTRWYTRIPMVDMSTNEMRSAAYLALSFFLLIFLLIPIFSALRTELKQALSCSDGGSLWCVVFTAVLSFCIMLLLSFVAGAVIVIPLNTSNSRLASRKWIVFAAVLTILWAVGSFVIWYFYDYNRRDRVDTEDDWSIFWFFCLAASILMFLLNIVFLLQDSMSRFRVVCASWERDELQAVHQAAAKEIDGLLRAALLEHDVQRKSRDEPNFFAALAPPQSRTTSGISRLIQSFRESLVALRDVLTARDKLVSEHGIVFPRRFVAAWLCQLAAYVLSVYWGAVAANSVISYYDDEATRTFWRKVLIPSAVLSSIASLFNLIAFGSQYVQTVRALRNGQLNRDTGCLRLLRYTSQMWKIGYLEAAAFYGQVWPYVVWYFAFGVLLGLFVWDVTRAYAVSIVIGAAASAVTVVLKIMVFKVIARGTTRRLYRLYPRVFNLFELSEIAYGVVIAGIWSIMRIVYLILFSAVYIGRLDVTMFSRRIERWDALNMVFMMAVLNQEAHLHPLIQRLAAVLLADMLSDFERDPHTSSWRALLVQSLVPPLRAHSCHLRIKQPASGTRAVNTE